MKLVTFMRRENRREEIGVLREGNRVLPISQTGLSFVDMNDLILHAGKEDLETIRNFQGETIPLEEVKLLAPIPRPLQDILCLGMNYMDHAREAAGYSKEAFTSDKAVAVYFSKRATWCQGDGDPIPAHADLTQKLDFENELAVILGKDAVNVRPEDAASYIFGYSIINDVSARDLQTGHKQWYFGKGLDGFSPMGPCIVTADEIAFPPALDLYTTLNGEQKQKSNTSLLIHDIPEILSELTRGMTLRAGTIIATGTPKGVLMGMENPVFMKPGDEVVCTIEGIGSLTNRVE